MKLLIVLIACLVTSVARADVGECRDWFSAVQYRADVAGIDDAGSEPLPGYPWLRTNRWLAFLQPQVTTEAQGEQWMELASREGFRHWRALLTRLDGSEAEIEELQRCIDSLTTFSAFPGVPRIPIPDAYSRLQRFFGVFPVARALAQPSINRYRQDMRSRFQRPLRTPVHYYLPRPFIGAPPPPSELSVNPLELAMPGDGATRALLSHYAPILVISDDSDANRPGVIRIGETAEVDASDVNAYTWLSWTRYLGHNLLQINYQFWFSERPPEGKRDMYAGKFDGLIWRVTLKPDGNVLFYDTIHACGCYHKIFPVARGLRESDQLLDGPVFYNRLAPNANQQRIALHLEPDTHYVVAIERESALREEVPTTDYGYLHADELRAITAESGAVLSLFDEHGLVPGSQRSERWLLWPLGVPSAGAMRQPGTHAISFADKRHFDDPMLLEMLFAPPRDRR